MSKNVTKRVVTTANDQHTSHLVWKVL